MKGDFSRSTFDPHKHYAGVLMQQGRVQLDADWNEQVEIAAHRSTTTARDVIGLCGAPFAEAGFEITVNGDDLMIGSGRYYVDGILCENEAPVSFSQQPDLPNPLNWIDQIGAKTFGLVYLDVWERHHTALDDGRLREVALGGPDTTTRLKTVWQVKVKPVQLGSRRPSAPRCDSTFSEWEAIVESSNAKLSARTVTPPVSDDACLIPPSAGYRSLENQLYRVEIHTGSEDGPTFKWSRDNGSVAAAIEKITGTQITVSSTGPDNDLGFGSSQWVEILDDAKELKGEPGQLAQIDDVNSATRTITLKTSATPLAPNADGVDTTLHPKLRRWDQTDATATDAGIPVAPNWVALEYGIEVQFSGDTYHTGDYWLIPARTATGAIEWPASGPNAPLAQLPVGITHHYCRLALVQYDAQTKTGTVTDCRNLFSPLTATTDACHVIATNWKNDSPFTAETLQKEGLRITFDRPLDPNSISNDSMIVATDIPSPLGSTVYFQPTVSRGVVGLDPNDACVIVWNSILPSEGSTPAVAASSAVAAAAAAADDATATPQPLRVHVTLKGHVIWGVAPGAGQDAHIYVDGQAFGQSDAEDATRTALRFPTGAGVEASDFYSWFDLTSP